MKEEIFTQEFAGLIKNLLANIPSVKVRSLVTDKRGAKPSAATLDFRATLQVGGKPWTLIGEVKRLGQPQEVRGAVGQLKHLLPQVPGKFKYALVLAPYISPESARICEEAGVGYADLSGNARLSFDNIYIETHGQGNAFKRHKEAKSLFTPKTQRALRVLLQGPLRPWKISKLAVESQISLGWASALKQQLVAREWVAEEKSGILVTKPGALLDAWAESDDWKQRTEVRQYSLLETEPVDIASSMVKGLKKSQLAFTQWFAGWLRQPYTLPPIVTTYVREWPKEELLEKMLHARRVAQGGRLWLVKPKEDGVFQPGQEVKGFPLVSDIQIYLDLLRAGQRGMEQAAELRKRKDFSGGWS